MASMDQRDAPSLIAGLRRCAEHFTYFTLGSEETRREKEINLKLVVVEYQI